jgi:hypothetical protein
MQNCTDYLSQEIYAGEISLGKRQTEALFKFEQPKTIKQVQSFLGLGSTIASPLIRLKR